jgi:AcrR family transcriptional regulator
MPPTTPASKRQQQAAATHGQLLTAAREVFEERGYQAATVAAVTERANTAHGTFYLYFRNKDDAFTQVISGVIDELFRESDAAWSADPKRGVHAAIRGFLEVFAAHEGLWRALLEAMLGNTELEQLWLRLRRQFIERISRTITTSQEAGWVRPIDPDLAAIALGAMVEWFAFTHLVLDPPASRSVDLTASIDVLADLWVHALYIRPDDPGYSGIDPAG